MTEIKLIIYFFNTDLLSAEKKAFLKKVMQKGLKCLSLLRLLIFQKISSYENVMQTRKIIVLTY